MSFLIIVTVSAMLVLACLTAAFKDDKTKGL